MGGLGYDKWDALDSDDDAPARPKAQPVRKQAVVATRESELQEAADESRRAQAELERLQERAESLQKAMEEHRQKMLAAGGSDDESYDDESFEETSSGDEASTAEGEEAVRNSDDKAARGSKAGAAPQRRRRMDREREVQEERIFEARPAPDGGRGQTIVAEFRSAAAEAASRPEEEGPAGPAAGEAPPTADGAGDAAPAAQQESAKASGEDKEGKKKPSLRRLKQLDQELSSAVQRECGLDLSKAEVFRLIMENRGSRLKEHTSVLVLAAGDKFLCPEPASSRGDGLGSASSSSAPATSSTAAAPVGAAHVPDDGAAAAGTAPAGESAAAAPAEASGAVGAAEAVPAVASGEPPDGAGGAHGGDGAAVADAGAAEAAAAEAPAAPPDAVGGTRGGDGAGTQQELGEPEPARGCGEQAGEQPAVPEAGGAGGGPDAPQQRSPPRPSGSGRGGQEGAGEEAEGVVEVELRFFRSTPRLPALAKKVGKVPTLHVGISTSDGLHQCLEFLGVHQRKYYAEEPATDAISRNLTESLLRVALEFVFHPSRSKYSKRRLVLRECSTSVEALRCRDDLLPRMVEKIKTMSKTIQEVSIEHCTPDSRSSIGQADTKKDRAFLVVDEDALKVAPPEKSVSRAPPAAKSFRGLGKGFLNTSEAKKHGLSHSAGVPPVGEASGQAASSSSAVPTAASVAEAIAPGERTRINPQVQPEEPHAMVTSAIERAAMILPSADLYPGVPESILEKVEGRPVVSMGAEVAAASVGSGGACSSAVEPDLPEEPGAAQASLQALADQLFGELAMEEEPEEPSAHESAEERTESTQTPSPTAGSSRAASERPERPDAPTTPDGAASASAGFEEEERAPAAGLRLLQQRRRGRGEAAQQAQPEPPQPPAPAPAKDESEDLVNLWMKQRW